MMRETGKLVLKGNGRVVKQTETNEISARLQLRDHSMAFVIDSERNLLL